MVTHCSLSSIGSASGATITPNNPNTTTNQAVKAAEERRYQGEAARVDGHSHPGDDDQRVGTVEHHHTQRNWRIR
jgi:hypothetical protein